MRLKSGIRVLTVGVTKSRSISANPAVGPEVTIAGCKFLSIPMTDAHVGGNLVTAPAWPVHPVWLAKSLQVLVRSVAEKAAGV